MKKLLVLLALVLTSGCYYSQKDGEKLEAFVKAQSEWNDHMRDRHYYVTGPGIHPAYRDTLLSTIKTICKAAGLSEAECDKLDPGEGDTADDPPKGQPPKWGG